MGEFDVEASNDIVKVGKDLISQGFSVAEHPDFTKNQQQLEEHILPVRAQYRMFIRDEGIMKVEQLTLLTGVDLLRILRQEIVVS